MLTLRNMIVSKIYDVKTIKINGNDIPMRQIVVEALNKKDNLVLAIWNKELINCESINVGDIINLKITCKVSYKDKFIINNLNVIKIFKKKKQITNSET